MDLAQAVGSFCEIIRRYRHALACNRAARLRECRSPGPRHSATGGDPCSRYAGRGHLWRQQRRKAARGEPLAAQELVGAAPHSRATTHESVSPRARLPAFLRESMRSFGWRQGRRSASRAGGLAGAGVASSESGAARIRFHRRRPASTQVAQSLPGCQAPSRLGARSQPQAGRPEHSHSKRVITVITQADSSHLARFMLGSSGAVTGSSPSCYQAAGCVARHRHPAYY